MADMTFRQIPQDTELCGSGICQEPDCPLLIQIIGGNVDDYDEVVGYRCRLFSADLKSEKIAGARINPTKCDGCMETKPKIFATAGTVFQVSITEEGFDEIFKNWNIPGDIIPDHR